MQHARLHYTVVLLLVLFWCALVAGIYFYFHHTPLSKEADEYLDVVATVNSGLALRNGVQKACFLLGFAMLISGTVVTIAKSSSNASRYLMLGALPIAIASALGDPEPLYPNLVSLKSQWLLTLAAALWGGASSLAWVSEHLERKDAGGAA